jgi:hypothetical protein
MTVSEFWNDFKRQLTTANTAFTAKIESKKNFLFAVPAVLAVVQAIFSA